jgi:hypothetical protein
VRSPFVDVCVHVLWPALHECEARAGGGGQETSHDCEPGRRVPATDFVVIGCRGCGVRPASLHPHSLLCPKVSTEFGAACHRVLHKDLPGKVSLQLAFPAGATRDALLMAPRREATEAAGASTSAGEGEGKEGLAPGPPAVDPLESILPFSPKGSSGKVCVWVTSGVKLNMAPSLALHRYQGPPPVPPHIPRVGRRSLEMRSRLPS